VSFSEAVCVAGIDMAQPHRWIRLFPLDFRGLERARRFRKYEVITLDAKKSVQDSRPESYTPVLDSIVTGEHIGSENGSWRSRMSYLDAVRDASMCEIQRRQKETRQSLGIFRPLEIEDLSVAPAPEAFAESQRAVIEQASLLEDRAGDSSRNPLEPLPVKAKFSYRCEDARCRGHNQSFIDWELGAFYRRIRDETSAAMPARLEAVRSHFLNLCDRTRDMHFVTGSMLAHPTSFLILGLVYPRRGSAPQTARLF